MIIKACNLNTDIVLNCGHEVSAAVPVYEDQFFRSSDRFNLFLFLGYAIQNATESLDFAGSDVTDYIIKIIDERNNGSISKNEHDQVRIIKERFCKIISSTESNISLPERQHVSPDGKVYRVNENIIRSPEILFNLNLH